jgi:hypothetical protein
MSSSQNRFWGRFCLLCFLVGLTSCTDGYPHATFIGGSGSVHVLYDSARVQQMVEDYDSDVKASLSSGDASLMAHRSMAHDMVMNELAKQPAFDVPRGCRFKILLETHMLPTYSKVEFDDGPCKGQIAWVSRAFIDDPRTRMP